MTKKELFKSSIAILVIGVFLLFTVVLLISMINSDNKQSNSTVNATSNAQSDTSGRCIITIDNQKYDITDYRDRHPGGDIFNCGTDMTSIFYGEHGSSTLKKIAKYKVN